MRDHIPLFQVTRGLQVQSVLLWACLVRGCLGDRPRDTHMWLLERVTKAHATEWRSSCRGACPSGFRGTVPGCVSGLAYTHLFVKAARACY